MDRRNKEQTHGMTGVGSYMISAYFSSITKKTHLTLSEYPMNRIILFILLSLSLASLSPSQQTSHAVLSDPLVAHIDTTVKPGNDFFLYANGRWFRENPIPPSEPMNGLWQVIQDTINAQIRSVCESSAIAKANKGSNRQKIGDFFLSGMDSVSLNVRGISDLTAELARIDRISDAASLSQTAAFIHTVSGSPLMSFAVGQDDRISSKNAIFIWQGGLSLPDRRFYLDPDSQAQQIRVKFAAHLERMFGIIGYTPSDARKASANVIELETALARAARKREDTRDPEKNYNKITYASLKTRTPAFNWTVFMDQVGLKNVDTVIIGQPEFLTSLNTLLSTRPLPAWKDYLKYHLVHRLSYYLDDRSFAESFGFYSTVLRGVPEPKPRWKRVVEQSDASLGELIGQVYSSEYLPKGTKEKLVEIGKAIKQSYAERITKLDWMSEQTKVKALKKLDGIIMKVGYPDKWKDLTALTVDRSSYVNNVMSANRWHFNFLMSKFGKPVDRTEWDMQPQTYNAYYNPSNNEIVIPGCNIIIPGFEHSLADDAILYAVIGATFGHELTHGFDDQGSKYDADGNLNNWWTPDDSSRFYNKTGLIVEQFNQYVAVDTLHINGDLTQGENIADLGGTMMAYAAFKRTEQYKGYGLIAGLNPDQRFFLGYALGWMVNERPELVANQVRSNEHSPAKFRVLGPLSNMAEFYATFKIKPGDAMWRTPEQRVRIW
jgi:putative endopeptidase